MLDTNYRGAQAQGGIFESQEVLFPDAKLLDNKGFIL